MGFGTKKRLDTPVRLWGVLGTAMLVALSGCATNEAVKQRIDKDQEDLTKSAAAVEQRFPKPGLLRLDEPLLTSMPIPVQSVKLPSQFNNRVSYAGVSAQTLSEVLGTLKQMTGMSFDVRDVLSTGSATNEQASALAAGSSTSLANERIHYRYDGRLSDLLDDLAQRMDASWRYDERLRRVVFFRYESRVLSVKLPPGSRQMEANISIGGSEGNASSGGSVSISSEMAIDPWAALMNGIDALLNQASPNSTNNTASNQATSGDGSNQIISGPGGRVVANRELAQVVMLARPETAARIADFVEQTNRRFARNVLIDVRVIELQNVANANVGASLGAVLNRTTRNSEFQVRLLGADLPGNDSGTTSGVTITGTRGDVNIDAVIQAMQSVGRVSLRNQGQIVAINGQPAPFQQANQISYLQSVQTTLNEGFSQTSLTPGTVTVGFTANFLPTIMADNRIMLQYQIQSSTLLGLRTFTSSDASIQLPEMFTQSLQQQAYLNDGDVLVLFGFEQERSQLNDMQGVLAVGRAGSQNRVVTAVIIQVRAERT